MGSTLKLDTETLLTELQGLKRQSEVERSHYYVRSVVTKTIHHLDMLQRRIDFLETLEELRK